MAQMGVPLAGEQNETVAIVQALSQRSMGRIFTKLGDLLQVRIMTGRRRSRRSRPPRMIVFADAMLSAPRTSSSSSACSAAARRR